MAKVLTGIEIGNFRMKIAEVRDKKVLKFVTVEVPENMVQEGQIASWDSMADFIRETVKENRISCKNVALVVPDEAVYIQRVNMPAMTEDQLKVNLPYEFHDFLTEDAEKYIFDYSLVEMHKNEDGSYKDMDLLAVAVERSTMDKYATMFHRAGMRLQYAVPDNRSVGKAVHGVHEIEKGKDFAVLDLGSNAVHLYIFTGGIYDVTRNIDPGCFALTQAIADMKHVDTHIAEIYKQKNQDNILDSEECRSVYASIAVEVMRAVNFYTFNHQNNTLDKLYYCGGGSQIRQLIGEIRDTVPLPLEPLMKEDAGDALTVQALMNGPAAVGITWD